MNERIKELAKQSNITITPMVIDGEEYDYEEVDMDGYDDLKQFAELIVRECAGIVREIFVTGPNTASIVLEHFGLKDEDE